MSLQKPLLILLLLAIASSVSSTACGSNPLLNIYGITADFTEAQVVSGLKYCKSLQNKETCCSAATINNFQTKTNSLLNRLRSSVAQRDESLITIRDTLVPSLNTELQAMKNASSQALRKILTSPPGSVNITVRQMVPYYGQMASTLTDNLWIMKDNFTNYQTARTVCVIDIVKIQAAAWCLACDPDFESKGVSEDGIEFSENLVDTLTDSCENFFARAMMQNIFFSFNQISSLLSNLTASMNKIAAGDETGSTELFIIGESSPYIPEELYYRQIRFPDGCSVGECEWIATDLFKKGKLDEDSLAFGGVIQNNGGSERRMLKKNSSNRVMAEGSWDPDMDEAGVTVTFEDSPQVDEGDQGDNGNDSMLQKGITGGLFVLFSVILIFS